MKPVKDNRIKVDINNWKGKKHFLWFKKYLIHYYSITKPIDVSPIVEYAKKNNRSFFITFLYVLTKALNQIEEMRLRVINDEVYLYSIIHPAYTVMTENGVFDNCDNEYDEDFETFYKNTKEAIQESKQGVKENVSYNDYSRQDQFFFTCLPWIDFTSVSHPMTNDETQYIPRIGWGKYIDENGKKVLSLNIHVSHALVDGYPLSQAFLKIEEEIKNFKH